ncbi:MAG: NAD-dependent epimerase/dehydratase family protein [Chloroflexota bacterium]
MIFVTGGTGFLGHHLIPRLCHAGYQLRVLTRTPQNHAWLSQYPTVEVIQGDIITNQGLDAMQGCQQVVHAAGLFSMWRGAGNFEATNVQGTQNLLNKSLQYDIQRFIHISTVAVIGNPQANQIIDESHPPRPADPYQASKLRAEQLVQYTVEEHHLNAVILRPGAFYGPLGDYAFNRIFFTDPMRGLIVEPDGGKYLTFPVYIADVVQGIISALNSGHSGEIYNISGESISHRQVYDIVCEEANLHYPRIHLPNLPAIWGVRLLTKLSKITGQEPFYPLGMRSYVFNDWHVSSEKARTELNFQPTSFREGAKRTIAWYRAGKPNHLPDLDC